MTHDLRTDAETVLSKPTIANRYDDAAHRLARHVLAETAPKRSVDAAFSEWIGDLFDDDSIEWDDAQDAFIAGWKAALKLETPDA